ncbi:MAG: DUF624 domain-containing protein, partial [Deinococcota bacterium]|nr:DUF624 domain-containing protein [Deinococcota bacterium]
MRILESRFYWTLRTFSNFILLNLFWLVLCLPLLTVFPATAALFAVVREWTRDSDATFYLFFFHRLRENFLQSFAVGAIWTLFGGALLLNLVLLDQLPTFLQLPLFLLASVWLLIYVSASVYLFPIMVNYRIGVWDVIKNAIVISLTQFGATILCLLVIL